MGLSRADVQSAFQNSLGRAASQTDEDAFYFASQDGDASDIQLYAAISNSREADLTADPVVRFYQAAFGRVPDQAGLDNATDYVRQFGASAETYQKLADMFAMSPEFQVRYGSGGSVDAGYVQALYVNILGREPSTAEIQAYVLGTNGYDTRGEVLYAISQSNEAIGYANNAVNAFLLNAAEGDAVYTGPLLPDTIAPRVLISLADASLEAGQTTQVTFDFTEQVTGFDLTDVATTRGSLSALVQSQTDPTLYTATLTAGSSGTGQIALTGAYTDAAGNAGRVDEADFSVEATPVPVNRAPTVVNDSYTTNEDTALVVPVRGVLANDTDPDGNALTATLVSGPTNGALTLNADGSFSYTPVANYFGTDSFTYRANDGSADSPPATVTLTVSSVNDAPIARADSYTTNENAVLVIPAGTGVLANDTDADSIAFTVNSFTQPGNGTLVLNLDGSFTYTPRANFFGSDTFAYTATDGDASSAPTTVTLNVRATVNANPDSNGYLVGSTALVTGNVLTNDTPNSVSNPLTVKNPVVREVTYGRITINEDGSYVYIPKDPNDPNVQLALSQPGAHQDQIPYTAVNSQGAEGSSTLTVTVNVPPVVQANDYLLDA